MQALEKELAGAEARLADLDRVLADPAVYEDGGRAAELTRERGQLARQRDEIEHAWLEAAARRDQLAEAGCDDPGET
jgi:hypothetical protein